MMAACGEVWAALMLLVLFCFTPAYAHFGSCEDHSPQCPGWAAVGRCQTHPQFMLPNCPVSCDSCVDPECFDKSPYCSFGVRLGLCRTNRRHMLNVCRHSCDACEVTEAAVRRVFRECGKALGSSTRRARQILFPDELEKMKGKAVNQRQALNSSTTITMLPGKPSMLTPVNRNMIRVNDTFCGATPISDRFLLTAAHCVFNPDFPVRTVRLGELDFSSDTEENSKPVDYEVEQIIVHPDFDPNTRVRYNDIALLRTVQKIEFNEFVFPYCLSRERPKPKTLVTGAGFGLVNATHQSPILQEAELQLVDTTECENIYKKEDFEPQLRLLYPDLLQGKDIMCASYPERSACQGDSGGPLFQDDPQGRRFLVGIVGSGVSCRGNGISKLPGLYVSVADHIDFIDSVLQARARTVAAPTFR
ncbi:venom peptide isomerase heavy chain isoform X2 [Procambarus clarkii]|uniref:venom peptide isomerase heavy chain isoform X2 n=1 Tax=Procambarus clarkii TaxID=6728 RepID=UPI001E679076|nr:CLIP domain-containing serine protease 2-like isoform X2 [Procambarus clarkii]